MKRLSFVLLTTLALGGVALAEDKATGSGSGMEKSDKMKGPPNADGAHRANSSDKTGTGSGGAASPKSTGETEGGGQKK